MKVGDKVVHVGLSPANAKPIQPDCTYKSPALNAVYVIERVIWMPSFGTLVGLALVGGYTVYNGLGEELGWDSRCFRPLDEVQQENREKKTNVEPNPHCVGQDSDSKTGKIL